MAQRVVYRCFKLSESMEKIVGFLSTKSSAQICSILRLRKKNRMVFGRTARERAATIEMLKVCSRQYWQYLISYALKLINNKVLQVIFCNPSKQAKFRSLAFTRGLIKCHTSNEPKKAICFIQPSNRKNSL